MDMSEDAVALLRHSIEPNYWDNLLRRLLYGLFPSSRIKFERLASSQVNVQPLRKVAMY